MKGRASTPVVRDEIAGVPLRQSQLGSERVRIGLFQSRAIVLAHDGGVHVEIEIGKGTSFQASFPNNAGRS